MMDSEYLHFEELYDGWASRRVPSRGDGINLRVLSGFDAPYVVRGRNLITSYHDLLEPWNRVFIDFERRSYRSAIVYVILRTYSTMLLTTTL